MEYLGRIGLVSAISATILLPLDLLQIITVSNTEEGFLDFLPPPCIAAMFLLYPICLVVSFILFLLYTSTKESYYKSVRFLLFINGITLLGMIILYNVNEGIFTQKTY